MCSYMLSYVLQTHTGKILIPFMNYQKQKGLIRMRGELQSFLRSVGVTEGDLLFLDGVFEKVYDQSKSINVFLVDHNEPSITWNLNYPDVCVNVLGIIDHHLDVQKFMDAVPRIISSTGSCSTLVLEYLREHRDSRERLAEAQNWLVYPLVLDTICFQRDTQLDLTWGSTMLLGRSDATREELQAAAKPLMADIDASLLSDDQFGLSEVLYKDYKLYSAHGQLYGISTIRVDIGHFIDQLCGVGAFEKAVREFMTGEDISVFCITAAVRDPATHQFYQQICLFCNDPSNCDCIKAKLEAAGCLLETIPKYTPLDIFYQNNPKLSRKQIQPAVHKFMLRK